METALNVGHEAIKNFQAAIELIEKRQNSTVKESDHTLEEHPNSHTDTSPYFGEITTNLMLSHIVLSLTDNAEKKKSLAAYMQGDDRENEVEEILEETINNWRTFQPFLTGLDQRTERCMGKITAQFDSSTFKVPGMQTQEFDPIRNLAKAQVERESIYYGSQFKGLLEKIKNNSKKLKIRMI